MTCIFVQEVEGGLGYASFFDTGDTYFVTPLGEYTAQKQFGRGRQIRIKALPVEVRRAVRSLEVGK